MSFDGDIYAPNVASLPSSGHEGNTGLEKAELCRSEYKFGQNYLQPPTWRAIANLGQSGRVQVTRIKNEQEETIECQCKAVKGTFNMLTFSCSEDREMWTWTNTTVTVGYTCDKIKKTG